MDLQQKQTLSKITMELIWCFFTGVAAFFIVQPLWKDFKDYFFIHQLIIYIIVFITFSRYIFFLKFTFLADAQKTKILLIFLAFPLFFYLLASFFELRSFMDRLSEGMLEYESYFRDGISDEQRFIAVNYLAKQYTFFGVSAIISVTVAPFRLILSIWRVYNQTGIV